MTVKLADRVKETSTTTGTGTLNLDGAVSGFQTFVAGIGTGNACYYAIVHQTAAEWETGIGTVTDATPDTLSRTTILASSNAGSVVTLSAGAKDVFVTIPAAYAGGRVLLKEVIASSSATVVFEGLISSLYDRYIVDFLNVLPATNSVDLRMQVGTGGTPTYDTGNNYAYTGVMTNESGSPTYSAAVSQAQMKLAAILSNNSSFGGFSGSMHVFNPGSSVVKDFTWEGCYVTTLYMHINSGGRYSPTTAITALKFYFSSGNIASGTVRLYGIIK